MGKHNLFLIIFSPALLGPGRRGEHCVFENRSGAVSLIPHGGDAPCLVNGVEVTRPCQLNQGEGAERLTLTPCIPNGNVMERLPRTDSIPRLNGYSAGFMFFSFPNLDHIRSLPFSFSFLSLMESTFCLWLPHLGNVTNKHTGHKRQIANSVPPTKHFEAREALDKDPDKAPGPPH